MLVWLMFLLAGFVQGFGEKFCFFHVSLYGNFYAKRKQVLCLKLVYARRLVGRRFSDVVVQSDIQHCPFKVVASPLDKPMIVVSYKDEKRFVAEEISVMVVRKMREVAEAFLGITVKNAMVNVPA